MIGLICSDFVQPFADILGTILRDDEALVSECAHVLTKFGANLKGNYLTLRMQMLEDLLGDDAVAGTKFNDGSCAGEVDPINCGRAQRGTTTGKCSRGA